MRKRLLKILLVVCLLLLVLVVAAPSLADTGLVRGYIADRIGETLGRPVALGELDAGWMSGVSMSALTVANERAEFGDGALLAVASVRIDESLTGLLFGEGVARIVVEGLEANVEEQAGGRTNIDDVLARLAPVPPHKRPPVTKVKRRPITIELTDCTVRVQRVARRPQPRPVDPFVEDPVVLPARDGAFVIAFDRCDVALFTDGVDLDARFSGAVLVNGLGGRVEGSVQVEAGEVAGKISTQDFDLDAVDPFVPPSVSGLLTLEATGDTRTGLDLSLRIQDFHLSGPRVPSVHEEWLELKGSAARDGARVRIDGLSLKTASDEIDVAGHGTVPPADGTEFGLRVRVPSHVVFAFTDRVPGTGALSVVVDGRARADGLEVAGKLASDGFQFYDPQLAREGVLRGVAEFDLTLAGKHLEVRRFHADLPRVKASLQGSASWEGSPVCDITGKAAADLDLLHHLLAPFLPFDRDAVIQGLVKTSDVELRVDAARNVDLKADIEVSDFAAVGVVPEEIFRERFEFHIDAAVTDDGDVLTVRRGQFEDLRMTAHVAGLREGIRHAEGEVKGSLRLTTVMARMLGLFDIDRSTGELAVDLKAQTRDGKVRAEGTATLRDLHVATQGIEIRHEQLSLEGWAGHVGKALGGDVAVKGGPFAFTARSQDVARKTHVALVLPALEKALALVPGLVLPPELELAGAVTVEGDLGRKEGWSFKGTVDAPALTARYRDLGFAEQKFTVDVRCAEAVDGLTLELPRIALPGHGIAGRLERGFFGSDGMFAGELHVDTDLGRLHGIVPALQPLDCAGRAGAAVAFTHDGAWSIDARANGEKVALTIGGHRFPARGLALELAAELSGAALDVEKVGLELGDLTLAGSGRMGRDLDVRLNLDGPVAELSHYIPAISGKGRFHFTDMRVELGADATLSAAGKLGGDDITLYGARLEGASHEFRVEGRRDGHNLRDAKLDVTLRAKEAVFKNFDATNIEMRTEATGEFIAGGGGGFEGKVTSKIESLLVDTVRWEDVKIELAGAGQDVLFATPRLDLKGDVSFSRWQLGPLPLKNAAAVVHIRQGTVYVNDFDATFSDGSVSLYGYLRPEPAPHMPWKVHCKARDIVLVESLGKKLSLVVPILRVGRGAESHLNGRIDTDFVLEADGTSDAQLMKTMKGEGKVMLKDVSVQGSTVLPLLGFRFDKLLTRRPYRFKDATVPVSIDQGTLTTKRFKLKGSPFNLTIWGSARLDGQVDFVVAPTLLLPMRVRGDLADPKVRLDPGARFEKD